MAAARSEKYCIELAREDYYLKGGEPLGRWWGGGAEKLGLRGNVAEAPFRALYRGQDPSGRGALVQDQGARKHFPGWDLTFSAPKSVSTAWSVAEPTLRHTIQRLHDEAVQYALSHIEREATLARRGKAGAVMERAEGAVVARFEHGTSRAQQPQLHTHCIFFNVASRTDGTWGSVLGRPLFQEKMAAGALYRAALAERLVEHGFELERSGRSFEIAGVPKNLMEHFSARRAEILAAMKADGAAGAKAASWYATTTRQKKGHVARDILFSRWSEAAKGFGFTAREVKALVRSRRRAPQARALREALAETRTHFTRRAQAFTSQAFLAQLAIVSAPAAVNPDSVRAAARKYLASSAVREVGEERGRKLYALPENLAAARRLVVEKQLARFRRVQSPRAKRVVKAIERVEAELSRPLTDREKAAVVAMVRAGSPLRQVEGLSVEEKLVSIRIAGRAHRDAGHDVHVLSPWRSTANALAGAVDLSKEGLLAKIRKPISPRAPRSVGMAVEQTAARLAGQDPAITSTTVTAFLKGLKSRGLISTYLQSQRGALSAYKVESRRTKLGKALELARAPFNSFRSTRGFLRYAEEVRKPSRRLTRRSVVIVEQADRAVRSELAELTRACNRAGASLILLQGPDGGGRLRADQKEKTTTRPDEGRKRATRDRERER